jgi:hypothetical protein
MNDNDYDPPESGKRLTETQIENLFVLAWTVLFVVTLLVFR